MKKLRKSTHDEVDRVLVKWFSQQRLKNVTISFTNESKRIRKETEKDFALTIEQVEDPNEHECYRQLAENRMANNKTGI